MIPFQPALPVRLPTIEGNVDYQTFREQLLLIDQQLMLSGLEDRFIQLDLERWMQGQKRVSAKAQQRRQQLSRLALRSNLARTLQGLSLREFAIRLADSPLLQFFCKINQIDRVLVPGKSDFQRFGTWWTPEELGQLSQELLRIGAQEPAKVCLPEAVDLEQCWLDTTCLQANIHYPVDWVLLRDATRTLMKAVTLIRAQGLKRRMEEPELFISRMNKLCIQMTQTSAKQDSQRHRKKTLRKMDKMVATVAGHARRYRQLLDQEWDQTEWTRAQAEQVLRRMDQVLEQLPQARRQARDRILSGQLTENKEKILSLYEREVRVIVRKKAGAEVEFGNTLFLAENAQGLIVDWELFKDTAPADPRLVRPSVERMQKAYGRVIKALGGDRGFDSEANREFLQDEDIYNGLCPRSPQDLKERNRSWKFKGLQRRRAQTEGRIAILKNVFVGQPARNKGFTHRALGVGWAVLTHNLWVMARMTLAAAKAKKAAA
jgi:hypothetical protein